MSELLVMRLADMHRRHPEQDDSRVCPRCGERVGIYPSGQAALRADPGMTIVCQICAALEPPPDVSIPAPGALDEPRQSYDYDLGKDLA